MKYVCQKCGFIHEGVMPDGYYCPLCLSNYSYFMLIEKEEKVYNRKKIDEKNLCINRINERCINCGACQKICERLACINDDTCINCGSCILTCPTGALTPKYDYKKVFDYIDNPEYIVIAITSPAVRVGLGDAFSEDYGSFLEGKMVSALKEVGFDYVFDVSFGADLTSMEEAFELKDKIAKKEVLFSSCCPSWLNYAKFYHPELTNNISSCKSPIGMESAIIKNYYLKEEDIDESKVILVAITPCTSKKQEIMNGDCDVCLTTSELVLMIKELGIDFNNLKEKEFDNLTGSSSGLIYGTSSGVTLSVLRCLYHKITNRDLHNDEIAIKDKDFYQEILVKINKEIIKCACVSTMANLEKIIPIKDEFNFIEVMNCEQGCIYGGGQPLTSQKERNDIIKSRCKNIKKQDKNAKIKYPYKNPIIKELYADFLEECGSKQAVKLLHRK